MLLIALNTVLLLHSLAGLPDSTAILAAARAAQAAFERLRLDYLPRSAGGSGGRCDEVVGRFCYWHDDDDDWVPPPEHPRIRQARERLLDQLDSLARMAPSDDWIAGQRVRYLVEADRGAEALNAALQCRGTLWWCYSLRAFAQHAARQFAAADSSYTEALLSMPTHERCRWTDLSEVLAQRPRDYGRASCEQRERLNTTIWWLADPLYLTPGNERRTEHYSRRVLNALQPDSRSPYAMTWGNDLERLLLRYGWPVGWERDDPWRTADRATVHVIARHAPRAREFLPRRRFVEDPATLQPGAWNIDPDRPRSGYAAPYARDFVALDPQVTVFWRGDSAIVMAAFERPILARGEGGRGATKRGQERGVAEQPIGAALVITAGPDATPVMARDSTQGPYRLAATVPARGALVSVEALPHGDSGVAGRERFWLSLRRPDGVAMSQPLLFAAHDPDSVPAVLELLFDSMLTHAAVAPGTPVGLYWETYLGDTSPGTARVTLTATRAGASWLRRAAERLSPTGRRQPVVRLSWSVAVPGVGIYPQSVAVTLPQGARGRFALEITMDIAGRTLRSERVVEVRQ